MNSKWKGPSADLRNLATKRRTTPRNRGRLEVLNNATAAATTDAVLPKWNFEQFASELTEPSPLTSARKAAWKRYSELPFPTRKVEEWRYTDISTIDFERLTPAIRTEDIDEELPDDVQEILSQSRDRAGVVVYRDGCVVHVELDQALADAGVILCSLAKAAENHPELLQQALFETRPSTAEEKLWTLHLAILSGGYLLHVPPGVELPAPIHTFNTLKTPGLLTSTHSLIMVERSARAAVIEEFISEDLDERTVSLHGTSVHCKDSAGIEYVTVQQYGRGVAHFSTQHTVAHHNAKSVTFNVGLGADLSRADVTSRLLGPGSDSEMLALWFGDAQQHFDHHTLQHHKAPHAHSDLLFKGALTDKASSVFRGLIQVDVGAQLTDAYQTNRNLLLSEGSRATALPNLEIEADDVRCSHGATIGQVDNTQLFYLMSRGLTQRQAERLLVFGFFDEVLGRLPMAGVRERIRGAIEEKIGL